MFSVSEISQISAKIAVPSSVIQNGDTCIVRLIINISNS